ncbi:aldolase catalytic domain-containing protein [Pseudoalteromonas sp. OOF1S-7]|uniref:aldolase catalytic domain-containing protein n=1 Tax=Pseudoalteromonas sp. OOF1S-7 TaxID=2917757 RepID=UPI001EF698C5|nr:aldolase catalytic domain-containing protein [Pseudoalteromonas sp. OOF1S-7]MCG7536343.1 aldolase catalytic domain-containing protein [Pseudoalteromonas sp. OOF1S-7]
MNTEKVLDCTLRDGGYYNKWDFESHVVDSYLNAMAQANIDYVELGLRNFPKEGFLGAYAYTTEEHLRSLSLPEGPSYGVMVDAKTILESGYDSVDGVNRLFAPAQDSVLTFVRVAAHFREVEHCGPIVQRLKELGYVVGFNLMQAGGKPGEVISEKAQMVVSWGVVDVLYFADSLGNMDDQEVHRIYESLRSAWKGEIGIHTHDNMCKGLSNTLKALEFGVTWVDCTVSGMGRGAGNTQTENLLAVFDGLNKKYKPSAVYELVIRYFEPMQKAYGWGSNLLYFLGAQNNVHPTYIQNLLSNTHYGTDEIVGAIDYLSRLEDSTSYNGGVLDTAVSFNSKATVVSGDEKTTTLARGKDVLLIANGPATKKYATAIDSYIRTRKPLVISLNIVEDIAQENIDYYVISHNSKFLSDMTRYVDLKKPVILPRHRFSPSELESLSGLEICDLGVEVKKGELSAGKRSVVIPSDITAAYILAMLLQSKPNSISLIGFDGYPSTDPRQLEMAAIFDLYSRNEGALPLKSLTPTTYQISEGSVYAEVG